jgi:hypothetical protein
MRIYEGSPRRDFEEVLRSIGAFLDTSAMRDILILEVPDGFVVQGLVTAVAGAWSESIGAITKETLKFEDDDIARFLDEARARRGSGPAAAASPGDHERALRVIGHWMDELKPRDIFLLEQDGSYIVRALVVGQAGIGHQLAEFTVDDIRSLADQGAALRAADPSGS